MSSLEQLLEQLSDFFEGPRAEGEPEFYALIEEALAELRAKHEVTDATVRACALSALSWAVGHLEGLGNPHPALFGQLVQARDDLLAAFRTDG